MSTRSGLRLFVLRVLVVSLLATLLGRLWYLQVYASDRYTKAAQENRVREVVEPATRGMIYDSSGRSIVENRTAMVVSVNRAVAGEMLDLVFIRFSVRDEGDTEDERALAMYCTSIGSLKQGEPSSHPLSVADIESESRIPPFASA